jgi:hypothetical protein
MVGAIHEAAHRTGGSLPFVCDKTLPLPLFLLIIMPDYFFFALAFSALAAFLAASAAAKAFCLAA